MLNTLITEYNLASPKITRLVGYDSTNYRVENGTKKYILKIYSDNREEIEQAEAENDVLIHLQKSKNNAYPAPVKNRKDKYTTAFFENNEKKYARLLTYLEGDFLGKATHTFELFKSLGSFIARLDLQLQSFSNKTIKKRRFKWDLQHFLLNEKYIKYIHSAGDSQIVREVFEQFKTNVLPVLTTLPKQVIHNDANEWNTLATGNKITGLIDFGDVCFTPRINELAIALTYALLGKDNPLEWATPVVSEYNKLVPLRTKEIGILYNLIAARLCTTVLNSAFERINRPENNYIQISEKPAWELLRKWMTINPDSAHKKFTTALLR